MWKIYKRFWFQDKEQIWYVEHINITIVYITLKYFQFMYRQLYFCIRFLIFNSICFTLHSYPNSWHTNMWPNIQLTEQHTYIVHWPDSMTSTLLHISQSRPVRSVKASTFYFFCKFWHILFTILYPSKDSLSDICVDVYIYLR